MIQGSDWLQVLSWCPLLWLYLCCCLWGWVGGVGGTLSLSITHEYDICCYEEYPCLYDHKRD